MQESNRPNYNKIYKDLISIKFPEKQSDFDHILNKTELSRLDIIKINNKLFASKENEELNQRFRSYSSSDIFKILKYQKESKLNNYQLALHFKLSRNTVAKWRKSFPDNGSYY